MLEQMVRYAGLQELQEVEDERLYLHEVESDAQECLCDTPADSKRKGQTINLALNRDSTARCG